MQEKRLKQLQEETEIEYSPVSFNRPLLWMHNVEKSKSDQPEVWAILGGFVVALLTMVAVTIALWSTTW